MVEEGAGRHRALLEQLDRAATTYQWLRPLLTQTIVALVAAEAAEARLREILRRHGLDESEEA